MYAWLWRKLPFGKWGKLGGSAVLVLGITALLWFVIFPWAEPILPFDDVQVGDPSGYSDVVPSSGDYDVPYATDEPTHSASPSPSPKPSPSRKR
jgi:hypothetical protein